jgi:hypothetical protein
MPALTEAGQRLTLDVARVVRITNSFGKTGRQLAYPGEVVNKKQG